MLRPPIRQKRARWAAVIAVTSALALIIFGFVVLVAGKAQRYVPPPQVHTTLPTTPGSYLGVYAAGAPVSYAGVTAFTRATGVRPRLVVYYSGWLEPFQANFARTAAKHGAVPLVQLDPTEISLAAIAQGQYDWYLISYARAVRAYRNPVILSFGHEMNGTWYSWGYRSTSPATFVAAWRHIVTVFRKAGTRNVTWLWTVNIIKTQNGQIPGPAAWWPGSSYVTWVGIDGYYLKPSWRFVPVFGPTIAAVRELTGDPILIAETSATPAAAQPEKIADLFAGIHTYGLLGLVWFDAIASRDYRLSDPEAIAEFRRDAKTYIRPTS
jgi:mannan endo-1,4-beta-mannosidase